jgi:hypothetical protein
MHRHLIAIAFLALIAGSGEAEVNSPSLTYYHETIDLDDSGGATVTVRCCLPGLSPRGTVSLPYAHAFWPDSFIVAGPIRELSSTTLHGRRQLNVSVAGAVTDKDTLEYRFHLPDASPFGTEQAGDFGNRSVTYRLVQSAADPVGRMEVCMLLPQGVVVNRIVETTPARKASAPGSPYTISMENGRHCVSLCDSSVLQGDVLFLAFEAKPDAKSPVIIALLGLCAVAYLIVFRDLLKPGQPKCVAPDVQN